MKFIHTSDWHIGRVLNDFSLLEDQRHLLTGLEALLEEERPDALVVAGDLYDRSVPPADAVALLGGFLNRVAGEMNIPVLAVSGNHDSPQRLSFGAPLLQRSGLFLEGVYRKDIARVTLQDSLGPVHFYLLPYVEPALVRADFPEETVKSYDDAFRVVIGHNLPAVDLTARNVLVAHGFFSYLKDPDSVARSESEVSLGGSDLIDARHMDPFDYAALGHIHRPQWVREPRMRYSGSLYKYSVSEWENEKSVTVVELGEKGSCSVSLRTLPALRDLRVLEGDFDSLLAEEPEEAGREDYIFARLSDRTLIPGAMARLRTVYPNILGLSLSSGGSGETLSQDFRTKSPEELFDDFCLAVTGEHPTEEEQAEFLSALKEVAP
ncbi:MAG: exonuclease SbcCD subunit D [Oscillospiraceae bacterium]|nr:exonuclease SbcCD subunit D [Oscillospiraceae bacterium]